MKEATVAVKSIEQQIERTYARIDELKKQIKKIESQLPPDKEEIAYFNGLITAKQSQVEMLKHLIESYANV